MLARKTGHPGPRAVSVAKEVILPAIKAIQSKSATPPKVPAPVANTPLSSTTPSTVPLIHSELIPLTPLPPSIPKDNLDIHSLLKPRPLQSTSYIDRVLATTVPVPVRELITMAPEVHKQLKDLSTAKGIPVSTNTVQINELTGRDPGKVD